jgi:hypothetical protein
MTRLWLPPWSRNADGPLLLESFFIAAVVSFLGVRGFLAVTGYPRVGSGGIHIAHMLWGGLLMLGAIMFLLAFMDRTISRTMAVVAGLGFGTFIDEIGKFVTTDNDYFYRPAVALIYALFVAAFLVARTLVGGRRLTQREALANALTQLSSSHPRSIEPDDRMRIEWLLERSDPDSRLTQAAKAHLAELHASKERRSLVERIQRHLADAYERLVQNPVAQRALVAVVAIYTILALVGVGLAVVAAQNSGAPEPTSVATFGEIVSTVVGAALVGRGVLALPESRTTAYHWYMRGLLVWILVSQVFVFYSSQLAGIGGLVVDLVAYGSLRFALNRETMAGRHSEGGLHKSELLPGTE